MSAPGDAHTRQADDVQRRAQRVQPWAKQPTVERQRTQRAPAARAAIAVMHVGHPAAGLELHGSVLLEERHHFRAMAQEGLLARIQFGDVGLGTQVAFRGVVAFDDAFGNRQRVAWNPQPAPDQALVPPSWLAFSATITCRP